MGMNPKEVNPQDQEAILEHLRKTMKSGGEFIILANINLGGTGQTMVCGSDPEDFTDFLVHAMNLNETTESLIMGAATRFITEKILARICPTCDDRSECEAMKASCMIPLEGVPEDLRKLIEKHGLSN